MDRPLPGNPRPLAAHPTCWLLPLVALALIASPAATQLPRASAELGLGNYTTAVARGFAAVATNPAGLAMPRASRVDFTVLAAGLESGLEPVTLQDFGQHDGEVVPTSVREAWLDRIAAAGHQRGTGEAALSGLALARGRFGVQVSAVGLADARLNPDAAELLLFGNAGRTGVPRPFFLEGSRADAYLFTTVAVAFALPLVVDVGDAPGQNFAVGATLKYTLGNRIYVVQDAGSAFSEDPFEIELQFPVIETSRTAGLRSGTGAAVDLGVQWEAGLWGFGLAFQNVVSTFRWDLDRLVFRPGTALFDQDGQESDFEPRPATEAPESLLDPVRRFRFAPRWALGVVHRPRSRTALIGEVRGRIGRGVSPDPGLEGGVGVEHRPHARSSLMTHVSFASEGVRLGGGAAFRLGPVELSGGASFVLVGRNESVAAAAAVSFGES